MVNLLDRVLGILANYELASCLCHTLYSIKDKTGRELGDMCRIINFLRQLNRLT